MDRLLARYPFLDAAREAVEAEGIDMAVLVADGSPVLDRAVARVETCLTEGTVGDPHRDPRAELLSYPVARVLVSLVDEPVLVRRYADAEARTAHERFTAELEDDRELRSTRTSGLTLPQLLDALSLSSHVREAASGFYVDVGRYLSLTGELSESEWRLVNRPLTDGVVPVSREELTILIREAVRERVAADLPLTVPTSVAEGLSEEVSQIESLLADSRPPDQFDAIVPELFPPCVTELLGQVADGEDLPYHSKFSLVSFLVAVGLSPEQVERLFERGGDAKIARYQANRVSDGTGAAYAPPSCDAMAAFGDCVNTDERCDAVDHPLSYYGSALSDAGGVPGWTESADSLFERLRSG